MNARLLVAAVGSVVALSVVPSTAAAANPAPAESTTQQKARPTIKGRVGPGFVITVSRHHASPGRYRLVVRDRSGDHNWHIKGPGVNRRTSVSGTGRTVWRVRLVRGTYRIVCDPHRTSMRTRLVVR